MSNHSCTVILDVDETLLNPLTLYEQHINAELDLDITVPQIEEAGGLDELFRNHPRFSEIAATVDRLRSDEDFNSNVPLIPGALAGVQHLAGMPNVRIGAYLTSRPSSVLGVTETDLRSKGFPTAPVIARPIEVPRAASVAWKVNVLKTWSPRPSRTLLVVDDNVDLAVAIGKEDKHVTTQPIVAILYLGPLTRASLGRSRSDGLQDEYLLIATWSEIPSICSRLAGE